ncbi:DNA/RNA non-specific endonuclease [Fibrisoma montanum]|uniref:Endonuclease n=1 Tax=Fibrisoma montanum TaxID=2305895 RepID=A0A418M5P7_9BACT|nr:DNA/RNA non-specific endonuclease [Fibrisoma montanum]RIV21268.1 DNA/RNA non-specific endonuclease [Fibrisoma montanum]
MSMKNNSYRRGFRLRGNTLVLLLIFFLIGLFLRYGGRTQPVVAFWNDVRAILGIGPSDRESRKRNPYQAPEPQEDVAEDESADRSDRKDKEEGVASDPKGAPEMASSRNKLFAFEKQVDFILPAYKPGDEIIRHDGFTLRYQERYEQADWVAYPLLGYETKGQADRDREQFQPDPQVKTGSALPSDYTRSGYDRGHLAPAGDFKFSQRLTSDSFYMSNMSPQAPEFNRGIWKELEELVRRWAVRDRGLYVVTGPVLKPGLPTIGRQNEIAVPKKYYKVLLYCNDPDIRMIGFLLDNKGSDSSLKQFVVPVDQIEQLTGIDFFPKLPDKLERELESKGRSETAADWFSL